MAQMMDEQLIDEVAQHGVIYNRQKYYLNGSSGGSTGHTKYETKDEAWQTVAMKLRTDVETCKKRWKYLRERYVSQRKQGDPPVYEHLSRPYLEKMKFLDQHIQPRKSYRNVPNFLTSPHSANSSNYSEYNMDSKSNGSMKNMNPFAAASASQQHYHQSQEQPHAMNALTTAAAAASALENPAGQVKIEADAFRDFAAAVASQQLQQISHSQIHHHHQAAAVAAAMAADSSQNYQEQFRESAPNGMGGSSNSMLNGGSGVGIPSSSSSMKSPLSSPLSTVNGVHNGAGHSASTPQQAAAHSSTSQLAHGYNECNNGDLDSSTSSNFNTKKPRVQLATSHSAHNNATPNNSNASNAHFTDDTDDDSDDNSSSVLHPQTILQDHADTHSHFDATASTSAAVMQRTGGTSTSTSSIGGGATIGGNSTHQHQQNMFPANADFLFQLYQQLPHQQQQQQQQSSSAQQQQQQYNKGQVPLQQHQLTPLNAPQRCSEHLLGELVTTELLKMTKERRKHVQKRILEILFFDD